MFYVSEIQTEAPCCFQTQLQQKVYEALERLQIPFQRVDTDEAITMEDCVAIDEKLDMNMVKTLFLCNRQQTDFYLFITVGNKPFRSKDFSNALGVARVSFAPTEQMERILGTKIEVATVFSSLLDTENKVRIVFDKEVTAEKMVWVQRWDNNRIYESTDRGYLQKIPALYQPYVALSLRCDMGLYQNRIVVKVGTSTLTNEMGKSDLRSFDRLACVLSDIQNMGYEVILVSSGAIAVGTNKLNIKERPSSMRMKQAAAAVGQCSMMFLYDKFFNDYDKTIAQILLNAEGYGTGRKERKSDKYIRCLVGNGYYSVVNENDSVSYTEIESEDRLFGDNDMLSAVVAVLCRAKRLVILSDINGLYDADPPIISNANLISRIEEIDETIYVLAGGGRFKAGERAV